jgi:hypothetical protein
MTVGKTTSFDRCSRVIAQSTLLTLRSDKVFDVQIMIVRPSELNGWFDEQPS